MVKVSTQHKIDFSYELQFKSHELTLNRVSQSISIIQPSILTIFLQLKNKGKIQIKTKIRT